MTSQPAPKKPQAPTPAPAKLKPLPFAFPFLRKGRGKSEASAQFTDEHEIYRLLAEREPSGAYLVSRKGMWHGGIHVTEAGAGQSLDLDAGLRCIADGVLIAFRANKTYPLSEIAAADGGSPVQAPYSTGFALVRHTMEFPQGTKLTFYSLYMHLMSWEDYANFPKRDKPSYWSRQWQVTQHAQDKSSPGRNGPVADPSQQGLRVRKSHPHGESIGIVPQGASLSIGKKEKNWGQVTDLYGASLYPPEAGGYVEPSRAIGGWVYLGQENGGPVVEEVIPDSMFDRVIATTNQTCTKGDPQGDGGGIPVKAGDLIGHLGRYDSLNQCTSGTRMAHIEVFCDDGIQSFLEQGRAWVNEHGPHKEDWTALGLPPEPTILRIAPGTVLYQRTEDKKRFVPGADPQSRKTDAVQVYSLAELARNSKRRIPEPHPNPDPGYPVNWWHVDGVNAQGQPIEGWVCDFNHGSGRITREFAQKWIDFECCADAHDPAHTIFATTQEWVDYASGANAADLASRSKLSPLMLKVYDALFTKGDGKQAADELCTLAQTERGGYPWLMQAASRLIVRHESEWANPSKWKQLIAELEKQTGPKPQHEEEQKRIDKLAWWDEVKVGVPGFPGPEVFHIHPIALRANFASTPDECQCGCCYEEVFQVTRMGSNYGPVYWGSKPMAKSTALGDMVSAGELSSSEQRILVAMSENEGKLDTVQSYDSEVVTAGAMQKTINPSGNGEFPAQVAQFKKSNEADYRDLFERCGWTVEGTGLTATMYYSHPALTGGEKITGESLKKIIRNGCSKSNFKSMIKNVPLASIVHAISSRSYEKRQLMDFIDRLRNIVLPTVPTHYSHTVGEYFVSDLGRATALDQSVNRPSYVGPDIGKALDTFFSRHPSVSKNPSAWGDNHAAYESEILEIYGPTRQMAKVGGVSVAPARYSSLKSNLA
ncbi:glycoside hydrolase family 19 protein [Burkholderia ubonensis]|uniref:glycoside hydrolase family 19 protein n=1 Tax=Burkholderia ubonensis TaxID=101571 RepID=UPI000AC14DE8|nr:glycoside hydrolase family 19 protein [Burkholderia ubonensis]